jgi:3-hydroxymyristoyl/3-hydroxydecanoyl-(acyl carrier protein) dehydratase
MNGGAGFFTDEEMASSRGITVSQKQGIQKEGFEPLLSCAKTRFEETDLLQLSEGHVADCFGAQYRQAGRNSSLRLPPPAMRMIDRVTSVDPKGGAWGLGLIVGEKILSPKHWYFNCHFKDDLCMPGVVIGEACSQLLQFYMLFLGLQTCTTDACFQPIPNLTLVGRNRGQIRPTSAVLTFQLEVIEIGLSPKPFVKANFNVIFKGMVISRGENLGIQLSEKTKVVE